MVWALFHRWSLRYKLHFLHVPGCKCWACPVLFLHHWHTTRHVCLSSLQTLVPLGFHTNDLFLKSRGPCVTCCVAVSQECSSQGGTLLKWCLQPFYQYQWKPSISAHTGAFLCGFCLTLPFEVSIMELLWYIAGFPSPSLSSRIFYWCWSPYSLRVGSAQISLWISVSCFVKFSVCYYS